MFSLPGYLVTDKVYESDRSVVCRGERLRDHLPVLIKTFRTKYPGPQEILRMKREFDIAQELDLEGVVRHYSLEQNKNGLALILEDFNAVSLDESLRLRPLNLKEFLELAIKLASILGDIHKRKIIHKDIKPQNILINPETQDVRFSDFGISSRLSRETQGITAPGMLEGTLAYMSPEQTGRMNRALDYRSDLYSLGVSFYMMLTGRLPFEAQDAMELVYCHIAKIPESPRVNVLGQELPGPVVQIVMKLLAKTAEKRYQSSYGLRTDLQECLRLLEEGDVHDFPLGRFDFSDSFSISQKLYGRDEQIAILESLYGEVVQGETRFAALKGPGGTGKSTLINELRYLSLRTKGFLVTGKFENSSRARPFGALADAFEELISRLLTEGKEEIAQWRQDLIKAFGPNGQILLDVIPDLQLIVGEQLPVPELSPVEARNRFTDLFRSFLRVFARPDHPLVIFLDDLQWADRATLELLPELLGDPESGGLMIIGAYREDEVRETHPLPAVLESIRRAHIEIHEIKLAPLALRHVYELIVDSLNLARVEPETFQAWHDRVLSPPPEVKESQNSFSEAVAEELLVPAGGDLTELVFRKTKGNPFFLREFLNRLYQEELLVFDAETGEWEWDLGKIKTRTVTDDVLVLMAGKIKELNPEGKQAVCEAACLGSKFQLNVLAGIHGKNPLSTAGDLEEALSQGIIIPESKEYKFIPKTDENEVNTEKSASYRFLHDRVRQAAYSLINEEDKQKNHLKIARLYIDTCSQLEVRERLIEFVNHYNLGRDLILDSSEKTRLIRMNLEAGIQAKNSTAYEDALRFFGIASDLLPMNAEEDLYEIYISLQVEMGETFYIQNNIQAAEERFNRVLKQARSPLEKLRTYETKIAIKTGRNQPADALAFGIHALSSLDIKIPENPTQAQADTELKKVLQKIKKHGTDHLRELPELRDPEKNAALRIMMHLCMPAYQLSSPLFPIIASRMAMVSLDDGNAGPSAYAWAALGILLAGQEHEFDDADAMGQLALDLVEKYGAREMKCRIYYLYAASLQHWKHNIAEKESYFRQAIQAGRETGDLQYVALCILQQNAFNLWSGSRPIDELYEELEKREPLLRSTGQKFAVDLNNIVRQYILNMQGAGKVKYSLSGRSFNEIDYLSLWREQNAAAGLFYVYFYKTLLAVLFGCYAEACEFAEHALRNSGAAAGSILIPILKYLQTLALAADYANQSPPNQKRILALQNENVQEMELWSAACPDNFEHRLLLMKAELARQSEDTAVAQDLYDRAVQKARDGGFHLDAALSNEIAGNYYVAINKERFARLYFREARLSYLNCGASARAEELERRFPGLGEESSGPDPKENAESQDTKEEEAPKVRDFSITVTTEAASAELDINSVFKASQALAGEIQLNGLLQKLIAIVMENAGAQKAVLLLAEDEVFYVQAMGDAIKDEIRAMERIPLESYHEIPHSALNYVERSGKTLVLDDASQEDNYREDPYIKGGGTLSLFCLPVQSRGRLIGLLYLENRSGAGVFTAQRVKILEMLSAQLATSIENAKLYANLERALNLEKQARDKQVEINKAISRFVPAEFLKILGKEDLLNLNLGDNVQKEMTVLFSDIRAFTALSEKMSPEENFLFINSYLGRIGPVVRKCGGFIDKYIGDAVMALFEDTDDALQGAVEMLRAMVPYNEGRKRAGYEPIFTGIGLNRGALMLGTIGEKDRMEGTVISDAVNLASRLEGMTRVYGGVLIVSGRTMESLHHPERYTSRVLDRVRVKGKKEPVTLVEILDGEPEERQDKKRSTLKYFNDGIQAYQEARFAEARDFFQLVRENDPLDVAARLYLERVAEFLDRGVPEGWDGVRDMLRK